MMSKLIFMLLIIDVLILINVLNFNLNLFIYLFLNLVVLIIFIKKYLKVDIINISKIINIIRTKKIRKNLLSDEKYLEKIEIKTFDGSNGTTHPYVIKFKEKLNGYKYYLVHTPYDNHNVEFENPSLCVSNDGLIFDKINGVSDPLLPIIKNKNSKFLKYYNDNFIFYDNNELQIWYRYTEENKNVNPYKLKNQIYRIISKDGVKFSKPELMIDDDGIWYLSPSIIKIKNLYYIYYFDKDLKMYCKTSKNLYNWSKPNLIVNNEYNDTYWHGEVKLINNKIYLLFLSKNYNLYLCETDINNPFVFNKCSKLKLNYYDKRNIYGNMHPYKSSFLIDNDYIILYIPYCVNTLNYFKLHGIRHTKWTMTYTKLKLDNFKKYVESD